MIPTRPPQYRYEAPAWPYTRAGSFALGMFLGLLVLGNFAHLMRSGLSGTYHETIPESQVKTK